MSEQPHPQPQDRNTAMAIGPKPFRHVRSAFKTIRSKASGIKPQQLSKRLNRMSLAPPDPRSCSPSSEVAGTNAKTVDQVETAHTETSSSSLAVAPQLSHHVPPTLTITTTTPSSASDRIFPSFPHLPTELRLKIWAYALTPQFLSFLLSGPTQQSNLDPRSCRRYPWRHVASPRRKVPALMSVNVEAREVALQWYTEKKMGMGVRWFDLDGAGGGRATGANMSTGREGGQTEGEDKWESCEKEEEVEKRNKMCYWRADRDVVWLDQCVRGWEEICDLDPNERPGGPNVGLGVIAASAAASASASSSSNSHAPHSHSQSRHSILFSTSEKDSSNKNNKKERKLCCNADGAHCEFFFDKKVRFLAMDKHMWSTWIRSAMTVCSGLEIVFVVVDHETKERNEEKRKTEEDHAAAERESGPSSSSGSTSPSSTSGSGSSSSIKDRDKKKGLKGKGRQKGFDDTHISSKSATWERVEVVLVERREEILAIIEERVEEESWTRNGRTRRTTPRRKISGSASASASGSESGIHGSGETTTAVAGQSPVSVC